MASIDTKDLIGLLAAGLSALAAITALWLSLWIANVQRHLQERQLKQDLYDKRYAVFLGAQDFLMHVVRVDGSIKLPSEEFRTFAYLREQAGFLFGPDVNSYLEDLKKKALALYPKCCERDRLAGMKQQDAALSIDISKVVGELVDSDFPKGKQVFAPYLKLSSELSAGNVIPMRINGWQRLWIVLLVLWLLPVFVFSYEFWPTTANISKGDIYLKMNPVDGKQLMDYYDIVATRLGATNAPNQIIEQEKQDKGFLAASPDRQKAYLSYVDPDFAKASPLDQDHYLANITGATGPIVKVDWYTLVFVPGVLQDDRDKTVREYRAALRHVLRLKEVRFALGSCAAWIVPSAAFYVFGLAIAWVRRGFMAVD